MTAPRRADIIPHRAGAGGRHICMGKRSKERQKRARLQRLRELALHLTALEPDIRDSFMCPVCRRVIPLHDEEEITDAHIVPKAAGGVASTFLCKRTCNSPFGARQDKWFGEHVRLARQEKPSIFDTRIQPKTFNIDGVPVQGFISTGADGGIDVRIDVHRNSPATNRLLDERFKSRPQAFNLTIPFPLLVQERLIRIGYLTAAYLRCFEAFGYSWVLQTYLDPLREQILHPEKEIFTPTIPKLEGARWGGAGWLGIVSTRDDVWLGYGLNDRIVLFPPIDRRDTRLAKVDGIQTRVRLLREFLPMEQPAGLAFDNRLLIAPDAMLAGRVPGVFSFYRSEGGPPQIVTAVSEQRAAELASDPTTVHFRISLR